MDGPRIVIIVEGNTEKAFKDPILAFVHNRLGASKPKPRIEWRPSQGRIETGDRLRIRVAKHLKSGASHVVALTDVYTGSRDFKDADDAIAKMRSWVPDEDRFHPHAAQYEVEAWLLPYWDRILALASSNKRRPAMSPEQVNHQTPQSKVIADAFRSGGGRRRYEKVRDAKAILKGADLADSINACPNFKAFMNTLLTLSGAEQLA